eukprot:2248111-Rhodomonas_salina.1
MSVPRKDSREVGQVTWDKLRDVRGPVGAQRIVSARQKLSEGDSWGRRCDLLPLFFSSSMPLSLIHI